MWLLNFSAFTSYFVNAIHITILTMITAIRLQNPTADSSPVETDSIFSPPFSFVSEPELLPVLLSFPESGFSGFAGFSG